MCTASDEFLGTISISNYSSIVIRPASEVKERELTSNVIDFPAMLYFSSSTLAINVATYPLLVLVSAASKVVST
jgi:hypothetical protein